MEYTDFIVSLVQRSGPTPNDYALLDRCIQRMHQAFLNGELQRDSVEAFWRLFGPALTNKTMQGLALLQPYGYAGDFEIIDRIYLKQITYDPELRAWDE